MSTMSNFRSLFIVAAAILAPAGCASDTADIPVNLADIENGKATFKTICSACHSTQEIGGSVLGPNLLGVVGRAAASQPEFITEYSPALQASRLIWSVETLDTFLVAPMAMVPGTLMPIMLKDDKTRADMIAYLESLK